MFVDAYALCAVLLREVDGAEFLSAMLGSPFSLTSPVAVYEATVALARTLDGDISLAHGQVIHLLDACGIQIVAIDAAVATAALDAFARFGKGRHPARLNMGDCFAYACARLHEAPLLFKGDDFAQTDVVAA
jgi:ribonuclease VapC